MNFAIHRLKQTLVILRERAFGAREASRITMLPALAMIATLLLTSLASSQILTGAVKNATTGKPSAGDEVILFKLGQGMEEGPHTQSDAQGKFSFKLDDPQSPHLVRAIHQDVTYHRMAPPGTTAVEVQVSDVAKKVDGIGVVADIMRIQAAGGQLQIIREFGVQNSSSPARTQRNERNLEFYIPDGAKIIDDSATATTENGNPLKSPPVPEGEKNKYAFDFPLRPGLTRFEVAYQLPYSGSANLNPRSVYTLEHFVVMTPKAMQFTSASPAAGFKLIDYPQEPTAAVQVASNTTLGENLSFKVSGEGTIEAPQESNAQGTPGGGEQTSPPDAQAGSRPGGGLGPPIDAPDPLQKYRWWILGGFAALLLLGGVLVASRQQAAARALKRRAGSSSAALMPDREQDREEDQEEDDYESAGASGSSARPSIPRPLSKLMEGIKEELFQLELERKQGQLSQAEYESAKAALDQTLDRALKREAQKA